MPRDHRHTQLDSERRCRATRRDGLPCMKWARRGRSYCVSHGGNKKKGQGPRLDRLPIVYAKLLPQTLAKVVETQLDAPVAEQLSALEELAVIKATARDVVALYGAAVESEDKDAVTSAGILVRDILSSVISCAEAAARIEATAKDKLSVFAVHHLINQVVKIAYRAFQHDLPGAKVFEKLIRDELVIPTEQNGTLITPDEDVVAMDATVPKE